MSKGYSILLVGGFALFMLAWIVYSELLAPGWVAAAVGGATPTHPNPLIAWYVGGWSYDTLDGYLTQWRIIARLFTACFLVFGLGALVLLHRPAVTPDRAGGWPMLLGKIALLLLLSGLALIGPRADLWPLLTAAVYTGVRPGPHPDQMSELDLIVVGADGSRRALGPHEFWGQGRAFEARHLLAHVADPGDDAYMPGLAEADPDPVVPETHRRYLLGLAGRAFPDVEVAAVEVRRTTWRVDPLALPPFDHDAPDDVRTVARLGAGE